jgi:predicted dehydrogenase
MIKIGLLGINDNSESAIEWLRSFSSCEIAGIYDADPEKGKKFSEKEGAFFTPNQFGLINSSDLLIVKGTLEHAYHLIIECIVNSKHVIIDEPFHLNIKEIDNLVKLSSEASVAIIPFVHYQYSYCISGIKSRLNKPVKLNFTFSRTMDPVYSKHELSDSLSGVVDIITSLIRANVRTVHLTTAKVFGTLPQLIHVNIEFDSGCSASAFFDFVSDKTDFELTIYQPGQIISANLVKNNAFIKTFNIGNPAGFEMEQLPLKQNENPFEEIIHTLVSAESNLSSLYQMESFKNKIVIHRKLKDKLALS